MCNFRVGQKVVHHIHFEDVLNKRELEFIGAVFPVIGNIYTIRHVDEDGVLLKEIVNPIFKFSDGIGEPHFCISKFRPLDHQFAEDLLAEITESVMKDELINA